MPRHTKNSRWASSPVIAVLLGIVILGGGFISNSSTTSTVDTCNDEIDNDGDGDTDGYDPECVTGSPFYDGVEDNSSVNSGGSPP